MQMHSFISDLLPFLEENAISTLYERNATFCADVNKTAIATPINIFVCPSAPDRDLAPTNTYVPSLLISPSSQKSTGMTKTMLDALDKKFTATYKGAITDYSVPAHASRKLAQSVGYILEDNSIKELPSMFPLPDTKKLLAALLPVLVSSAVVEISERTRAAQITDGLSHTFMLTEVAGRPQRWQFGLHTSLGEPLTSAWADPSIVFKIKGVATADGTCLLNCDNNGGIYSFHGESVNFLFADGHVDSLHTDIEPALLLGLMTPAGGDRHE